MFIFLLLICVWSKLHWLLIVEAQFYYNTIQNSPNKTIKWPINTIKQPSWKEKNSQQCNKLVLARQKFRTMRNNGPCKKIHPTKRKFWLEVKKHMGNFLQKCNVSKMVSLNFESQSKMVIGHSRDIGIHQILVRVKLWVKQS